VGWGCSAGLAFLTNLGTSAYGQKPKPCSLSRDQMMLCKRLGLPLWNNELFFDYPSGAYWTVGLSFPNLGSVGLGSRLRWPWLQVLLFSWLWLLS